MDSEFDEQRLARLEQQVAFLFQHLGLSPAAAGADESMLPPAFYDALRTGRKIEAIRIYRKLTGLGLAEAKRVVDKMAAKQSW